MRVFLPLVLGGLLCSRALAAPACPFVQLETVCFRPGPIACDLVAIGLIASAKSSLEVSAFELTSASIAGAITTAKRRGVKVRVLIDQKQLHEPYSKVNALTGVEVRVAALPGLMHDKTLVVDGEVVVTGSYNWTVSAERRNAENLIAMRSQCAAALYLGHFNALWKDGVPTS